MKVALIDDIALFNSDYRRVLEQVDGVEVVKELTDGMDALNYLQTADVDLILLDLDIPRLGGYQLLELIKEKPIMVVIITGHNESENINKKIHYDKMVLAYLAKPVSDEEIIKVIGFAKTKMNSVQSKRLEFINHKRERIVINPNDILYCEADGPYTRIYLKSKPKSPEVISYGLSKTENSVSSYGILLRIHHSYIINTNHIHSIKNYIISIEGIAAGIPISRPYRELFDSLFNRLGES